MSLPTTKKSIFETIKLTAKSFLNSKRTTAPNEHYLESKAVIDDIKVERKGDTKRKCAIFVMVQNEKVFLPIWLKYYSKYFDGDDIFVFDHRSTDDSIEESQKTFKFRHLRLGYPFSFDHQWFQYVEENTYVKLLESYEYVLFTDVDEIIMADSNKYSGLDDYINKQKADRVRCLGYDLINVKDKEADFDSNETVLSQRKYWYRTKLYDKTLLSKIPLKLTIGNHTLSGFRQPKQDKDLLLIHLHKLDFDMCWNKNVEKAKLKWNDVDLDTERGWQNRITEMEDFKEYFYNWPKGIEIEEIPQGVRDTNLF